VVRPGRYEKVADLVPAALSNEAKDIAREMFHSFGRLGRQAA
jgi:hypothetical protein